MKKRIIGSFFLFILLLALPAILQTAKAEAATGPLVVTSVKLPVYKSFEELSDYRLQTQTAHLAELSLNEKVTILEEKDYAAKISARNGQVIGWVHRAYLNTALTNQTWLVKEWRNLRKTPDSSEFVGRVENNAKVKVLDYKADSNYYLIQTQDGQQGWMYGLYLENQVTKINKGSNIIPYEEGSNPNQISIFTPLNKKANITANSINSFINYKTNFTKTLMTGMGATYIQAQNQTNLNAVYLLAHSGLESKWGTSDIAKTKSNFYGIGADDANPTEGAKTFSNPSDGILSGAKWINERFVSRQNYMEDYPFPQPTLDNMRFNSGLHQYSLDEAWASKIAQIAKEFNQFTNNTGWKTINGKNYYYNQDWTMKTGWLQLNGAWYYLDNTGAMQTGWVKTGGKWYYLDASGVMKTGWQYIGGKWYYMKAAGDMQTGRLYTGGKWYYLSASGAMSTGWLYTGGKWYYLNGSGAMQTGWVYVNRKWYYLYSDGHMAANTKIGGYRLGNDGAML
ncbi:glucosaminidase domain-containing protein [Neobacillus vireti]|uniref:glucosaminidase domain-containing protein n=1 Tax=Neobacillus vireti TaxID=220686 RepID=UPI003000D415